LFTKQIHIDKRKTISEILAIVALTLLLIDTTNTLISRGTYDLLTLTDQQSGIYLGLPSVIIFFLSFGIAFGLKSRLTTALLIAGGTLLAVSKIVEPVLGSNLYLVLVLPYLYYSLIIIGFVILGMGIFRVIRKQ
jgi:hypothetical protein